MVCYKSKRSAPLTHMLRKIITAVLYGDSLSIYDASYESDNKHMLPHLLRTALFIVNNIVCLLYCIVAADMQFVL